MIEETENGWCGYSRGDLKDWGIERNTFLSFKLINNILRFSSTTISISSIKKSYTFIIVVVTFPHLSVPILLLPSIPTIKSKSKRESRATRSRKVIEATNELEHRRQPILGRTSHHGSNPFISRRPRERSGRPSRAHPVPTDPRLWIRSGVRSASARANSSSRTRVQLLSSLFLQRELYEALVSTGGCGAPRAKSGNARGKLLARFGFARTVKRGGFLRELRNYVKREGFHPPSSCGIEL